MGNSHTRTKDVAHAMTTSGGKKLAQNEEHSKAVTIDVGDPNAPGTLCLKFVVLSDTHRKHRFMTIPDGDVLLHCGDWSNWKSNKLDTKDFNEWLGELPHEMKLCVAGNHEIHLEKRSASQGPRHVQDKLLPNAIYVEGGIVNLKARGSPAEDPGIQLWLGPWTPARNFTYRANAFALSASKLREKWKKIPDDVDILITHCPPYGIMDSHHKGHHMGCPSLVQEIQRACPKLHIFGHCHDDTGVRRCRLDTRHAFAARVERDSTSVQESAQNANHEWRCPSCTFLNRAGYLQCEVCNAEKSFRFVRLSSDPSVSDSAVMEDTNVPDPFHAAASQKPRSEHEHDVTFVNAANKYRMAPIIINYYYRPRGPSKRQKPAAESKGELREPTESAAPVPEDGSTSADADVRADPQPDSLERSDADEDAPRTSIWTYTRTLSNVTDSFLSEERIPLARSTDVDDDGPQATHPGSNKIARDDTAVRRQSSPSHVLPASGKRQEDEAAGSLRSLRSRSSNDAPEDLDDY